MKRIGMGMLGSALLWLAIATPAALADGGTSIASATPVTPGQTEYGNTADAPPLNDGGCTFNDSWWSLPVIAGDHVTINWQGQPGGASLYLYPVGTTDYTVNQTTDFFNDVAGSNGYNSHAFIASRTGSIPMKFEDWQDCGAPEPGPYSFTVSVRHAMVVAMTSYTHPSAWHETVSYKLTSATGQLLSGVAAYVQVQDNVGSGWQTFASGTTTTGVCSALGHFSRTHALFRAIVTASGYLTTTSQTLSVSNLQQR